MYIICNAVCLHDEKQLNRICKAFEKQGGKIQIDEESERYLNYRGGEGVTYNEKLILLRKNPNRAAVFEELIHSTQFRKKKMDSNSVIKCEIEAKQKLLKNATAYKLTPQEILDTQKSLQDYQELLKNKK